jgi:arylsulfatase
MIFDLLMDPKEETDAGLSANWVRTPIRHMMHAFQQSLKKHPPIPPGAPDDYVPT